MGQEDDHESNLAKLALLRVKRTLRHFEVPKHVRKCRAEHYSSKFNNIYDFTDGILTLALCFLTQAELDVNANAVRHRGDYGGIEEDDDVEVAKEIPQRNCVKLSLSTLRGHSSTDRSIVGRQRLRPSYDPPPSRRRPSRSGWTTSVPASNKAQRLRGNNPCCIWQTNSWSIWRQFAAPAAVDFRPRSNRVNTFAHNPPTIHVAAVVSSREHAVFLVVLQVAWWEAKVMRERGRNGPCKVGP